MYRWCITAKPSVVTSTRADHPLLWPTRPWFVGREVIKDDVKTASRAGCLNTSTLIPSLGESSKGMKIAVGKHTRNHITFSDALALSQSFLVNEHPDVHEGACDGIMRAVNGAKSGTIGWT